MRHEHEYKSRHDEYSSEPLPCERRAGTAGGEYLLGRMDTRHVGTVRVGIVRLMGVLTREK